MLIGGDPLGLSNPGEVEVRGIGQNVRVGNLGHVDRARAVIADEMGIERPGSVAGLGQEAEIRRGVCPLDQGLVGDVDVDYHGNGGSSAKRERDIPC